jgi:hypothetical protein
MTDEDLRAELERLRPFEGDEPWLYLDANGLVTTGIGYLLRDVDAALKLPWHHNADGLRATPVEVREDWARVTAMPKGLRAEAYKGSLRLSPEAIEAEGFRRLRLLLAGLPAVFPSYNGLHPSAQLCLLDLGWNCGLGPSPGLFGWTGLRRALCTVPPDYLTAAHECTTANINHLTAREARNAWRAQCMLTAAAGTAQ